MAVILKGLRQFDAQVWLPHVCRIVQRDKLPCASITPIVTEYGSLYYRSVHYYSDNPRYPYVRLLKHCNSPLPLVVCCAKPAYELFLQDLVKGSFVNTDIVIPIAYREQVADL